jgi:hypothetical protein
LIEQLKDLEEYKNDLDPEEYKYFSISIKDK